jgi:thiol-disulfide isomerase/thioredoxin
MSDVIRRARLKGVARLALTLFPLTLVVQGNLSAQGEGAVSLPVGSETPAAALQDLDGDPVQLLDYIGEGPTLIEFWAVWCENCEALQPQLDQIRATYGDRLNVVAVAVAVAQSLRRVRRHVEEHDPDYPYLWDDRGAAVRAYEVPTTSVVVIVGADGRVAYTGVGPEQDLLAAVEALLGS